MRIIPPALQTHIEGEVLSLTRCMKITRSDGVILRLTTHDVNLLVNGDVYQAGIPLDFSALESTDTLSVDNAEITLGIDETVIRTTDLNAGLYDNASFELFLVNWENTSQGVIFLKRGSLGDSEITEGVSAKIQLRGLTYLLQRPVVERYSLTCRAALGGKRCGVANSPTRVRRKRQRVKTWDWILKPAANVTTPSLSNLGFETAALVSWTSAPGSLWSRVNAITPAEGSYYAEAGVGSVNQEHTLYRDETIASLGMVSGNVDTGDYSVDFSAAITRTSGVHRNPGKMFVEQYNALGVTLKREETDYIYPENGVWEGIGVTSVVLPLCRTIRFGFLAKVDNGGAGFIAFDEVGIRKWTNESSTWGGKVYRTVRIPSYHVTDSLLLSNQNFETGAVSNTNIASAISGWTLSGYGRVVSTSGGLSSQSGSLFFMGGDDGSTLPNSIYEISQTKDIPSTVTAQNVTDGWYYTEARVYAARSDSDSSHRILVQFLDAANGVLGSLDSGFFTLTTEDSWSLKKLGGRAPSGTKKVKLILRSRSGASGSLSGAAFDTARLYFTATAYENEADAEIGLLSKDDVSYPSVLKDYVIDGEVIVQTQPIVFNYSTVTAVTDTRIFTSSGINDTAQNLYSGRIQWLSGQNAGKTSYIRVWDNTTKVVKLYDNIQYPIQIGDKFIYAKGCDKTIATCADTFGNAHNFRGEPYLPGTAKVIEFLSSTDA
jgi:hypothetical protein